MKGRLLAEASSPLEINSPPFLFMWGIFPLIVGNNPHCNGEKHPLLWGEYYSSAISIGIDD